MSSAEWGFSVPTLRRGKGHWACGVPWSRSHSATNPFFRMQVCVPGGAGASVAGLRDVQAFRTLLRSSEACCSIRRFISPTGHGRTSLWRGRFVSRITPYTGGFMRTWVPTACHSRLPAAPCTAAQPIWPKTIKGAHRAGLSLIGGRLMDAPDDCGRILDVASQRGHAEGTDDPAASGSNIGASGVVYRDLLSAQLDVSSRMDGDGMQSVHGQIGAWDRARQSDHDAIPFLGGISGV